MKRAFVHASLALLAGVVIFILTESLIDLGDVEHASLMSNDPYAQSRAIRIVAQTLFSRYLVPIALLAHVLVVAFDAVVEKLRTK